MREDTLDIEKRRIFIAHSEYFVERLSARCIGIDLIRLTAVEVFIPANSHDRFAGSDKAIVDIKGQFFTGSERRVRKRPVVVGRFGRQEYGKALCLCDPE